LFVVHGFGEHSGRYHEFFDALEHLPISVYASDLRGHGQSEGAKVDVVSFSDFINDLYHFRMFIELELGPFRNMPILLGHSLGGLVATLAALQNQDAWRFLMLTSPFFGLTSCNNLWKAITHATRTVLPKMVWKNPVKARNLTHDPAEMAQYKTDPLIYRRISSRLADEMLKAADLAMSKAEDLRIALFILASGNDRIVSLERTKEFFAKTNSKTKMVRVLDGFYHELFHEKERRLAFSIIRTQLEQLVF
jgi:lysophospholipase